MSPVLGRVDRFTKNLCRGAYNNVKVNHGCLKPKYLWVEITDKCNSRCEYCNIHKKTPTPDPLTPQEIKKVLSDPLFKDVRYLLNSGGELSVRTELLEILLAEHEVLPQAFLQISTNGLLPDRIINVAKELISRDIKFEVGVSLDGVGAEHDAIRGVPGNFAKVDYLIRELVKLKVRVTSGATLVNKNIESNLKARQYAKALGAPFIYHWFNTSTFYGNQAVDRSKNYRETDMMERAIKDVTPPGLYREMWLKELQGKAPRFRCFALNTFAILRCNGEISPCLSLWDKTIGNVRNETPTNLWYSQRAKDVRREIKNCSGCLNSWGACWSLEESYYPLLMNRIKRKLVPFAHDSNDDNSLTTNGASPENITAAEEIACST